MVDVRAWREGLGLTLDGAAARLGVGRRSLIRYESGEREVPAGLAAQMSESVVPEPVEKVAAAVVEVPATSSDVPPGPGYTQGPKSHTELGLSATWDEREPMAGWQRVEGGIRIVRAEIPGPTNWLAPWAGSRGVVTKDGRVFDATTGALMKRIGR